MFEARLEYLFATLLATLTIIIQQKLCFHAKTKIANICKTDIEGTEGVRVCLSTCACVFMCVRARARV